MTLGNYAEVMLVAGVRAIKNRLDHYLRLIQRGEVVLVTDRGRVVAQLSPLPVRQLVLGTAETEALDRLARLGRLRPGSGAVESATAAPLPALAEPIDLGGLLDEVRADRR
ncbi:MAG: hypothetical protein QME96_05550 [Myxococcota bacterium]|nr:hypothetical protein [Myxococcota bacterium]